MPMQYLDAVTLVLEESVNVNVNTQSHPCCSCALVLSTSVILTVHLCHTPCVCNTRKLSVQLALTYTWMDVLNLTLP